MYLSIKIIKRKPILDWSPEARRESSHTLPLVIAALNKKTLIFQVRATLDTTSLPQEEEKRFSSSPCNSSANERLS